ncbi:MAG: class I SAM-dependent methyltransferase [Treponema sp.]|nr:class I SAM-dependent methyltransferase [Treponema sp.]
MPDKMERGWIWFDWLVAAFRYGMVNRYVREGSVVADIGCGREGAFLKSHAEKISHGYGFDFRIPTHEEGNLSLVNNRELGGRLPLDDGKVDDVFLNAVLEHLEDPEGVVTEAARILKSGGRIIMTTPTRISKPILEFLSYKLHLIDEEEIREHKHYFNRADIVGLVASVNEHLPPPMYIVLKRYAFFELGLNSLIILRKE